MAKKYSVKTEPMSEVEMVGKVLDALIDVVERLEKIAEKLRSNR